MRNLSRTLLALTTVTLAGLQPSGAADPIPDPGVLEVTYGANIRFEGRWVMSFSVVHQSLPDPNSLGYVPGPGEAVLRQQTCASGRFWYLRCRKDVLRGRSYGNLGRFGIPANEPSPTLDRMTFDGSVGGDGSRQCALHVEWEAIGDPEVLTTPSQADPASGAAAVVTRRPARALLAQMSGKRWCSSIRWGGTGEIWRSVRVVAPAPPA